MANVTVILRNNAGELDSVCFGPHRVDDITLASVTEAVERISGGWILRDGDEITIHVNEH